MRRGELHHLPGSDRTYLIIQSDAVTAAAPTVIALPVTTRPQRAGYPLTVALDADVLSEPAWVKITTPQTLARHALTGPLTRLETTVLDQVDRALTAVLGLSEP